MDERIRKQTLAETVESIDTPPIEGEWQYSNISSENNSSKNQENVKGKYITSIYTTVKIGTNRASNNGMCRVADIHA